RALWMARRASAGLSRVMITHPTASMRRRRYYGVARMRVLVTGGSRGIGAEIVRTLRARGDDVVAVGRDPDALAAIGGETLQLDVTDPSGWEAVGQVEGLVCAAGVLAPVGAL